MYEKDSSQNFLPQTERWRKKNNSDQLPAIAIMKDQVVCIL
jgi:hypothetical protein